MNEGLILGFKKFLVVLLLFFATNVIASLRSNGNQKFNANASEAEQAWVEKTLASMTLDEKIGQLIIPATVGMFLTQDSDTFKQIKRDITEFHVGGYHVLGEVNFLHEPAGVALLLNHMQEMSKLPLWVTADFEGGVGLRYMGATRFPRAMAIGATANTDLAFQAGRVTAEEARAMGVHVNFYPVVDVNNN